LICGVYIILYIYILILRIISEWFRVLFLFYQFHTCHQGQPSYRGSIDQIFPSFFSMANWVYLQNLVFGMEKISGSPVEYTYLDFLLPPNKRRIVENYTIDHTHTYGFVNQNFWSHWIWKKLHDP
jgi:hypothetical protein